MIDDSLDIAKLRWLVESRSENQRISFMLYEILSLHKEILKKDYHLRSAFYLMLDANFSMWRAVFLSDAGRIAENVLGDAEVFLLNLIQHNAVTYNNDYRARNYTFIYYMKSARSRLEKLKNKKPNLIKSDLLEDDFRMTAQEWWQVNHEVLLEAVKNFQGDLSDDPSPAAAQALKVA